MRISALEELKELMAYFPDSYINHNLELILIPIIRSGSHMEVLND